MADIAPGTYDARPVAWQAGYTSRSNLPCVTVDFELLPDGPRIMHDFVLQSNAGDLLTFNLDALRDALGWNGRMDFWATEPSHDIVVELVIDNEEYNGRVRSRVQFLNKPGSGRKVQKSDPATLQQLETALGSRLRAHFGGISQPPPAVPKPPAPPAKPPAAPTKSAPPAKPIATATEEQAWAAFSAQAQALELDQAKTEAMWFDVIGHYAAAAPNVTPQEWAQIRDHKLDGIPF